MDEKHPLFPLLSERLPALGLDFETYGPYIQGVLPNSLLEAEVEEEWDSVFELLQASSETHSDDEKVWNELSLDIQSAWEKHLQGLARQATQEKERQEQEFQEKLEKEKKIAEEEKLALEDRKEKATAANDSVEVDENKRALLARFAYDEDSGEIGTSSNASGKKKGTSFAAAAAPVSNKEVAAAAAKEQANLRKQSNTVSKKEEQQKTKVARAEKARLKEERRKRATKGERRR